jgi:hypothetical protein
MSEGVFQGIADPKLAFLARRVANAGRLAALSAIARIGDPSKVAAATSDSRIEQIALSRFRVQPAAKHRRGIEKAKAFVALPPVARGRRFGALAAIDLGGSGAIDAKAMAAPVPAPMKIDASHLKRIAENPGLLFADADGPNDGRLAPQANFDNLKLRIRKVKCNDETDGAFGSEAGDDEISLGGISIDETGDTKKIAAFVVSNSFDDGEVKTYNPPKDFAKFDLTEGSNWPKNYYVSLVLAEVDNGGLPSYLNDLFQYAKDKVTELISQEGTAVLGKELGKIVTAIAVAAMQALLDFFTSIWEDDLFPVVTAHAKIKSFNHVFASGGRTSSEKHYWVAAHGGKYTMYFDWQVYQ